MKLKHLQVYLTLLLLTFTISCSNKQLTEDECLEAFLEMDYVEAAEFYRDNLDSQPWVPLTYHKYIVPVLEESDIFTLRELMPILDGTTAGRKIASVYLLQRNIIRKYVLKLTN